MYKIKFACIYINMLGMYIYQMLAIPAYICDIIIIVNNFLPLAKMEIYSSNSNKVINIF